MNSSIHLIHKNYIISFNFDILEKIIASCDSSVLLYWCRKLNVTQIRSICRGICNSNHHILVILEEIQFHSWASTNDFIQIFHFSTPPLLLPSSCQPSYAMKIIPNCHFCTPNLTFLGDFTHRWPLSKINLMTWHMYLRYIVGTWYHFPTCNQKFWLFNYL